MRGQHGVPPIGQVRRAAHESALGAPERGHSAPHRRRARDGDGCASDQSFCVQGFGAVALAWSQRGSSTGAGSASVDGRLLVTSQSVPIRVRTNKGNHQIHGSNRPVWGWSASPPTSSRLVSVPGPCRGLRVARPRADLTPQRPPTARCQGDHRTHSRPGHRRRHRIDLVGPARLGRHRSNDVGDGNRLSWRVGSAADL